jgi:hypothetical protein
MDMTTLLIIVVIVLLLGGGGFYGRGRWWWGRFNECYWIQISPWRRNGRRSISGLESGRFRRRLRIGSPTRTIRDIITKSPGARFRFADLGQAQYLFCQTPQLGRLFDLPGDAHQLFDFFRFQ